MNDLFDGFAGIDWGSEHHQACLVDGDGKVLGEKSFPHSGAGLARMCDWLRAVAGTEEAHIAVGIEVPHGPVVDSLLEQGFAAFAINPKQLDRFRDRFTVAGAKDDRRDARVLGDSLRTDRQCFHRLETDQPVVIELREYSRMAEELCQERVRLANRLRQHLLRYYPQMLELNDDVAAEWFLDLWHRVPTPDKGRRLRQSTAAKLLKSHRIRRIDAEQLCAILRQPALTVALGTVQAVSARIRSLAERLRLVNSQKKQVLKRLDACCAAITGQPDDAQSDHDRGKVIEQRDVEILRSLPGIGRIILATLLAEASRPLRERDYHALRMLSGVAPVTRQSGKRRSVVRRQACHARLREAVYHWACGAMQRDPLSRRRYLALRARGHSHGRAIRTIGDRLLAVACAMLTTQTLFEPNRHETAAKAA